MTLLWRRGKLGWVAAGIVVLGIIAIVSQRASQHGTSSRVGVRGGSLLTLDDPDSGARARTPHASRAHSDSAGDVAALEARVAHLEEKLNGMLNQVGRCCTVHVLA
jgi:hypothetical protein